jgi:hypothetical protein
MIRTSFRPWRLCSLALAMMCAVASHAQETPTPRAKRTPCAFQCQPQRRVCLRSVRADFHGCAQEMCGEALAAAQQACADDDTTVACQDARQALITCRRACRSPVATGVDACRSEVSNCRLLCPTPVAPAADPQCASQCSGRVRGCVDTAQTAVQACREQCRTALHDAMNACREDPTSPTCGESQKAAGECLQICSASLRAAGQRCAMTDASCASSCVPATPTPRERPEHP